MSLATSEAMLTPLTISAVFFLAFEAAARGARCEGAKLKVACFEELAAVFFVGAFLVAVLVAVWLPNRSV